MHERVCDTLDCLLHSRRASRTLQHSSHTLSHCNTRHTLHTRVYLRRTHSRTHSSSHSNNTAHTLQTPTILGTLCNAQYTHVSRSRVYSHLIHANTHCNHTAHTLNAQSTCVSHTPTLVSHTARHTLTLTLALARTLGPSLEHPL